MERNNPYYAYLSELNEHFSSNSSALQDICIYLYVTRRGLSEKMLRQLVPIKNVNEILHVMYFDLQKNNNEYYLFGSDMIGTAVKMLFIDRDGIRIRDYIERVLSVLEKERDHLDPAYCFELLEDILEQWLSLGDQEGLWRILVDCAMLANIWYDNKELICNCFEKIEKKDALIASWFDHILKDDQTNAQYAVPSLLFTVRRFRDATRFYAVCLKRLDGCEYSKELATLHNNYAVSLFKSNGCPSIAKNHLMRSLKMRVMLFDPLLGDSYRNLSLFYMERNNRRAMYYAKRSLKERKAFFGENAPQTGYAYLDLADIASGKGKCDAAINLYLKAEKIFLKTLSESDVAFGNLYFCMACNYYKKKDYERMIAHNLRAYEVYRSLPYLNDSYASVCNNLAQGYLLTSQLQSAISYAKKYYLHLKSTNQDAAQQVLDDMRHNISVFGEQVSLDDWGEQQTE